jgi:hypothetical protein
MGEWKLQIDPLGRNDLFGWFLDAVMGQFVILEEAVLMGFVDNI